MEIPTQSANHTIETIYLYEEKKKKIQLRMPPNSTDAKNADEIQVAFSHEEPHSDDGISPRLLSRVKWKLDLFILPIISIVYFFAQMVRTNGSHVMVLYTTGY
jgi:hypothetical protein